MTMVELTTQRYEWSCRRCGHRWTWVYEIRRRDWGADEMVIWRRDGFDTSPPAAGASCPRCGGIRTRARGLPPEYLVGADTTVGGRDDLLDAQR